MASVECAED